MVRRPARRGPRRVARPRLPAAATRPGRSSRTLLVDDRLQRDLLVGDSLGLEYSTDLFDHRTVRRLARHFTHALRQGPAHPGPRVGQLRIMIPRSRSRLAHRPGRAPSATTPSSSALRGTGGPSGSRQPVDRNNDAREVAILADARELLGRPTLRATYDFFDHGANSMFTLQLVARSRAQHHGPPRQRAEQSHRPWTCRGATAGPVRRPRRARHLVRRPTRAEQPVAREGLVPLGLLTAALA